MSIEQGYRELNELGTAMKELQRWIWLTIFLFWLIIPIIILFVKFIIYYIKLGKAASVTKNPEIRKMFVLNLTGLLLGLIITPLNPLLGYNFVLNQVLSYIRIFLPVITLYGYISFGKFAKNYAMSTNIIDGANKLKLSAIIDLIIQILRLFVISRILVYLMDILYYTENMMNLIDLFIFFIFSGISFIFFSIGLNRAGEGLQEAFGSHVGIGQQGTQYQYQTQGAPIPSTQQLSGKKAQFCPNCGNQNLDDTNFCNKCGSSLS